MSVGRGFRTGGVSALHVKGLRRWDDMCTARRLVGCSSVVDWYEKRKRRRRRTVELQRRGRDSGVVCYAQGKLGSSYMWIGKGVWVHMAVRSNSIWNLGINLSLDELLWCIWVSSNNLGYVEGTFGGRERDGSFTWNCIPGNMRLRVCRSLGDQCEIISLTGIYVIRP